MAGKLLAGVPFKEIAWHLQQDAQSSDAFGGTCQLTAMPAARSTWTFSSSFRRLKESNNKRIQEMLKDADADGVRVKRKV